MGNKSSLFLRHEEIAQIQNETGCKLLQGPGETRNLEAKTNNNNCRNYFENKYAVVNSIFILCK